MASARFPSVRSGEIGDEFFGDAPSTKRPPPPSIAPRCRPHPGDRREPARNHRAPGAGGRTEPGRGWRARAGEHLHRRLGTDLEKVRLVNVAVRQIPPSNCPRAHAASRRGSMRPRPAFAPGARSRAPWPPAAFAAHAAGRVGGTDKGGAAVLSALRCQYCRALINLGYRDGMAAKKDLLPSCGKGEVATYSGTFTLVP